MEVPVMFVRRLLFFICCIPSLTNSYATDLALPGLRIQPLVNKKIVQNNQPTKDCDTVKVKDISNYCPNEEEEPGSCVELVLSSSSSLQDCWKNSTATIRGVMSMSIGNPNKEILSTIAQKDFPRLLKLEIVKASKETIDRVKDLNFLKYLSELSMIEISCTEFFYTTLEEICKLMPSLNTLIIKKTDMLYFDTEIMESLKTLQKLDLSENRLQRIRFTNDILGQIQHLNISYNEVTQLLWKKDKKFTPSFLKIVDFSHNNLTSVPEFMSHSLHPAKLINLSGNQWDIRHCSFYHLWKLIFTCDSTKATVHIDMADAELVKPNLGECSWESCPDRCICYPETFTIDCSSLGLMEAPEIGPSNAQRLLLQNNSISHGGIQSIFNKPCWCNLRSIHLDQNNLTSLLSLTKRLEGACPCLEFGTPDNCFPQHLEQLSVTENSFAFFTYQDWLLLSRIASLNFSRNSIQDNAFTIKDPLVTGFAQARFLDLSHNLLRNACSEIIAKFPYLEHLNLAHNQIELVSTDALQIAPHLKTIDLSNNRIIHFPEPTHEEDEVYSSYKTDWQELYLSHNRISQMFQPFTQGLHDISLHANPWDCLQCSNVKRMQHFLWYNMKPNVFDAFRRVGCGMESCEEQNVHSMTISPDPTNLYNLTEYSVVHNLEEKVNHYGTSLIVLFVFTVIVIVVLVCFASPWRTIFLKFRRKAKTSSAELLQRRYDVFVIFAQPDEEFVVRNVICHLDNKYSVAYPSRTFIIGRYEQENFLEALHNSKRLLIFLTNQSMQCNQLRWMLKEGMVEEVFSEGFKVGALIADFNPPEEDCPEYLRSFISKRTYVHFDDIDWFDRLQKLFLAPN